MLADRQTNRCTDRNTPLPYWGAVTMMSQLRLVAPTLRRVNKSNFVHQALKSNSVTIVSHIVKPFLTACL